MPPAADLATLTLPPQALPWAVADLALRAATIGLLLFAAARLWADHPRLAAARWTAAFALGVAAFVAQHALWFGAPLAAWQRAAAALAAGNAVVMWLCASHLFNDAFRTRAWHLAAWLALAGLGWWACLGVAAPLPRLLLPAAAWLGAAATAWQVWRSARGDLVEARRRARIGLLGVAAAYTVASVPLRLALGIRPAADLAAPGWVLGDAVVLALLTTAVLWTLLRTRGSDLWAEAPTAPAPRPDPEPPPLAVLPEPSPPLPAPARAEDEALAQALQRLMSEERAYRTEGLTIALLALKLDVPEYRLRRCIHDRLGHRHFNVYLNQHRLAEVKAALADPSRAAEPVLQLALEAGFQSIGPFNRAFKADTGQTPTEFRRRALAATGTS